MAVPELLQSLLVAPGPSGQEDEPARVWREAASAFADVTSDTLGSSFARVTRRRAAPGAPVLAIVGHIDEIGIAVTNVEDSGLLSFATIGGISAEMLLGQRFELLTRNGRVPGVIGRRRPKPEEARDRVRLELRRSAPRHRREGSRRTPRRSSASATPRSGRRAASSCPNGRLVSRSLDNRLGAFVALEAARRVADAGGAQLDVVAVAAVQEEIGLYGARVAGYGLDPTVAIAVDVTHATDYPGGNASLAGRVDLGGGAMIARGPTLNRQVVDGLGAVAARERHRARVRGLHPRYAHRRRRAASLARGRPDRLCSRSRFATCTARPSSATSPTSRRRCSWSPRTRCRSPATSPLPARAVIVSAVRTPFGKLGGGLAGYPATELGGLVIAAALERIGLEPDEPQYVIMGQVLQAGAGQAPARQAAIAGGLPIETPADTINKVCASSIRAIEIADSMIRAGDVEVVVTGGMESMSNAPYLLAKARFGYRLGNGEVLDSMVYDGLTSTFDGLHMVQQNSQVVARARDLAERAGRLGRTLAGSAPRARRTTAGSRTSSCRSAT